MHALIGAYQPEGAEWVDQLCQVLSQNINYACDYIGAHFEGVEVSKPEGTYMCFWIVPAGVKYRDNPSNKL